MMRTRGVFGVAFNLGRHLGMSLGHSQWINPDLGASMRLLTGRALGEYGGPGEARSVRHGLGVVDRQADR